MSQDLHIARGVHLPVDAVTETIAILGKRGVGKTYAALKLAEQILEAQQQLVVVDPVGVCWGLRSNRDGTAASGLPIYIAGGDEADIPLTEHDAEVIAKCIVRDRVSLILDISHFSNAAQRRFVGQLANGIYDGKGPKKYRTPMHIILDEADEFAPQNPQGEAAVSRGAVDRLVRRGRARGVGITMATQRASVISKDVLTQIELLIAMRVVAPQDRKAIDDWVRAKAEIGEREEVMDSLASLDVGEAWLWSPGRFKLFERARILQRRTFDSSETPLVDGEARQVVLGDVDLEQLRGQLAQTIEQSKADDPKLLKQRIVELETQLTKAGESQESPEERQAAIGAAVSAAIATRDGHWRQALAGVQLPSLGMVASARTCIEGMETVLKNLDEVVREAPPMNGLAESVQPAVVSTRGPTSRPIRSTGTPIERARSCDILPDIGDSSMAGPERKILASAGWWASIGVDEPSRTQLAIVAGYHERTKGFLNALGSLRSKGLIEGHRLTGEGRSIAPMQSRPTLKAYHGLIREQLNGVPLRVFDSLLERGGSLARTELAELLGYHERTKSFLNALGRLRTFGFIDYRAGEIVTTDLVYPAGLA